jgi:arginyl-tRNA synthetase
MSLENILKQEITTLVIEQYGIEVTDKMVQLQKTRPEFQGHITLVIFPFIKLVRKAPAQLANEIGEQLIKRCPQIVAAFNAVQGFLNLTISQHFWAEQLQQIINNPQYGQFPKRNQTLMVEYSSPNTNKPLHLGHVRNNLLGYSIARIQQANGWDVIKTNIVNDRGIHICKSMLAWLKFGNGATPQSTGKKGDHLIGDYYVLFDKHYKNEVQQLVEQGMQEEIAKKEAPLMKEAQAMLLKWEQGDQQIRSLWKMMNEWVYQGFDQTYQQMGVSFDKIYYESDTYLEGKKEVEKGLDLGLFYRRPDNSVWADLSNEGLDEKLLLRADGTSVYMTQDIGTAKLRFIDYPINKMVYVVGNEQEYHFKVLSILLDKLGFPVGKELVHFSYGMVELPNGKMKSREGTVVDADDLMAQMIEQAAAMSQDKVNTLPDITTQEAQDIARIVGMGALKYFILKVDPRKNMLFNPEESIDFNGNTGPFIQYTYARIQSVLRKSKQNNNLQDTQHCDMNDKEINLIQRLCEYPAVVHQAGEEYSPAVIANYIYSLACDYNSFYHDYSILGETDPTIRNFRLTLSSAVANIIQKGMFLLGIEVPQRM